jgi:myo-inositol-1(or 4)-monophosphatase
MRELEFIEKFFRENRAYVREKYASKKDLIVTSKLDANDLLTEVDLTIQKRIVDDIRNRFPGDDILAEEGDLNVTPKSAPARCWVIDPIDGTANFVRGLFPIFAISVAFTRNGKTAAAGVLFPESGEMLLAARGAGATRGGKRLRVSSVQEPAEARLDVDFGILSDRQPSFDRFTRLLCNTGQLRCHGSAVASICQIATGDIDAYVHVTLHPWDFAAAQLIVEEAGGTATRLDGAPLEVFDGKKGVMISNGALHAPMMRLLTR